MVTTRTRASVSATRRWATTTEADRKARTAKAVEAATERRRKAHRVLDALEAAGITVELSGDEGPS